MRSSRPWLNSRIVPVRWQDAHRYWTGVALYFGELRKGEVRQTPKFSESRPVASRNRLLRFLARFVAKRRGYRRGPDQVAIGCPSLGRRSLEIATANFGEFLFHALR